MMNETRITQLDLIALASGIWADMSDVSYFNTVKDSLRLRRYFMELQSHRVVEIGPGNNPVNRYYPCGTYVSAPGYPNDGVTALRKEQERSAVVVSFGVLDDAILGGTVPAQKRRSLALRYIEELVTETRRVMNPFSIIVGSDAVKYMGKADVSVADMGGVYFRK